MVSPSRTVNPGGASGSSSSHASGTETGPPALETRRALEISGLDRHFTVHESVSEALLAKV